MSTPTHELSANFYSLIHQLRSPAEEKGAERRRQRRTPFRAVQRIAPYSAPLFPPEDAFIGVRCRDLTCGGFSFLFPTWPGFDCLVAEFGTPGNPTYVTAQVVHAEQAIVYASGRVQRLGPGAAPVQHGSRSGQTMFLVGCRFLERIERPA